MLDYFTHKFNPDNFVLAMTILVKNEHDIIESNIRTHAKLGVDAFVVMDNGSTDGTRDILEKLSNEFEMTIIDEKGPYQQKKFMTRLAFEAKKIYKADWVINNDADEFWIPKNSKTLKEVLNFKGGVVWVHRSNMSLYEGLTHWSEAKYFTANQVHYRVGEPNIILGKIGRKVIVNPYGLFQINSGNHSAEHIAFWKKQECEDIHIYHYPIRSYEQFETNIKNRKVLLDTVPNVKMGNHYRRWVKIYEDSELEEEYKRFLFKNEEIEFLKRIGILRVTEVSKELFIENR
ncbi:MAG: glycosyltransferase family 2 protein [Campylobacterota bacterium]|nr:glycosyltransferase family 2 protein [Campylobacterota bacterium]